MLSFLVLSATAVTAPKSCCANMGEFASDPAFVAAHLAPRPMRFAPTEGHAVSIPVKGKAAAGFFVPASKGKSVAVIMVHEWWGMNDYIRREAERLHDKTGYAVLAVDLYEGKVATDEKEAGQLMGQVDATRAKSIVGSAVNSLKTGTFGIRAKKLGTVGFCFGGGWSYQTAVAGGKNVNACVMFYGMPDTSPAALSALKAPVLMVHAKKDQWINDKVVGDFEAAMKKVKKPLTVLHYDAAHGFANPSNPIYDQKSADDAWAHTVAFYKKTLG